jgi:hypothetical protein
MEERVAAGRERSGRPTVRREEVLRFKGRDKDRLGG